MFIKIIIVLLLLIVAASLLGGRGRAAASARAPLRPFFMRIALVLLAIGGAVVAFHLGGCSRPADSFHATDVTGASYGRLAALDGLTDHAGRQVATADFAGKAVVVFFGYTHCPDICPTTLAAMKDTMALLGVEADRVQVLFVSVDPERDSQEQLRAYVPWFDARFLGLYGDAQATLAAAREFRAFYAKVKGSSALDYSIDHTASSYVFDQQGRLRLQVRHGETPQHLADDLRRLLSEK